MGNNNTNTKLFIEAVLADMSGLSKELRKNLESVDTELPLKFDSEELEEGVLGALREAFRGLESSRFASQLDLSEFISAIFKQLQQGTVTNDKADFVYAFADSVKIFESFAERFGGDAKVVSQTIKELNESLTAQGIQDYLTNLKAVYKFVDNLELKPKDKDRLLASFTSSLGVGVDANGLGDALGLKKVLEDDAEKFKDVTKYAVSIKEARKRLIELLGGTDDFKGWNDLLAGTKSRSDTARTRDIAGFISRIEALSGKEITAYLQDKIDDAKTDTTTRAQLEHLQKLYTEKGGWGEYYLKWSEKDNAGLQTLTQNNNLIVEMTKRQLEERQKVFEKYGKYNSSLLTKGQSPQATIEYDTKAEAAQVNEELTIEEQTRRQIADQINQEAEELKKKLNVLKEIAELQKQVVNSGVEATPEYQEMQYLQDVLDDVTLAVNNKTKAFEDERGVVHSVAKAEVKDLQSIQDKLLEITGFENEEDKIGRISKPRQDLKKVTEEQRKQAEEAQRAAEEAAQTRAEEVRKGTVLGQLRRGQEQEGEKSKDKPKSGATLRKQNLPSAGASNKTSEKTANEREAQALKDINANAESAAAGLKKFGDTNSEIVQNVATVAEALKKEASALNSITRTLLKVEDSKIFQDTRKDKLQTALSETRDNIASSQKEVEALQKSTDIKIFNNDHLEEASAQLRSAYKDVATFKDIYSKDASHENMIEMTKREIKLWKAYKEAEKQGIADSNLEAKRLNPANFGIDSNKNADNIKILRDEIESRKQIYEDYVRQAENIQKELEVIENPPTQKNLEKKDATIKDYQEAIGIIKEYIQAQMELAKVQEVSSSESIEAKFNPEQLEQFVITLGTISETLNKIQTASESFGKNIDFSMVIEQLESINNILSTFMGNITFDDFKDIFTVTIDEAVDKVNEFKSALDLDNTSNKFKEQISQMEEKIKELQSQLQGKDSIENKSIEAAFKPEQLEQLQLTFGQIRDSLNNIQTALGTLDDNSDIPSITKAVEEMVKVFEKLKILIDDINDKKIKFGFSLNPDEKLIGEMNSEDVQNSLTKMFDDAIQKIQDFKTNVDMSETVKNFKKQISEMEKSIKTLEKALEKEKKAREKDKADVKAKEEKRAQQATQKAEEKARQEALAKEKAEQEQRQKEEEALRKKQEAEEQKRQAEEIAKKKREAQEQYENQFHVWDKDGQLSFLDKNEYLELQKQEAEQLAKQAEQNPPKVDIPIEGQISFINEKDINEIADEILYKNNFAVDENGQYSLFQDVEAASDWGQELKENLQEASKTDFSNIKNQLSLKDWEATIDKINKSVESRFKKIYGSKSFIQNKDLPNDVLQKYENISTENGKGYKATSNLRELKNLGDELKDVKTKLKVSFDEAGNLKSTADPLQVQELLKRYDKLVEKIQKIKLLIESPDSKEFKLLKDIKETEAEAEKLTSVLEKTYAKLSNPEKILTDTEKFLNPFAEANIPMTESIEQLIDSVGRMKDIRSELTSSFDSEGKLIGDPQKVQNLITEYNNLSKVVDELKVKISSPTSKENIALKTAKDAEKAKKELDNLKNKIDNFFAVRKKDTVESTVQSAIRDYGATNENGELRSIESPFFSDNKDLIQQQQYIISLSKALDEYRIAVDNLKKTRESDNIQLDDLKEANKQVELLENKIKELEKAIKKIGKGNTNATDNQINGLKTKIQNILDKNTSLSTDATDKLKGYLDVLNSGASISKSAYNSMSADIKQFSAEQTKSLTIWDLMTMKMREGVAFLATKFSFYQIFNQFRRGIEVVHQFDDALTEMMKVSDETRKTLEDYQKTTFDTADAIGTSALQLQNSTADFMRLGENLNEAAESAKVANVLMNVSEFQSIDEATKSLIAMSAAYDDLSKMNIIDKLNEVGNNYSISTSGAAEALQMSASALKTAGNDMDEALALVTAGNQVVQDISKAGNGLRTIALRLTGK